MPVLENLLTPGLKLVICGSAVGTKSKEAGAYYAGPGNQFWTILNKAGVTPRKLCHQEYRKLLSFDVGLTDLAKEVFGADSVLKATDFNRKELDARIQEIRPNVLGFNGKKAAKHYFGRDVDYGRQAEQIGPTIIYVLPSTSGAARRFWNEDYWLAAATEAGFRHP